MRRVLVGAKFRDFFLLISIYIEDSKTNLKILEAQREQKTIFPSYKVFVHQKLLLFVA